MRNYHFPNRRKAIASVVALMSAVLGLIMGTGAETAVQNIREAVELAGYIPYAWFTAQRVALFWWVPIGLCIGILLWGFWPRKLLTPEPPKPLPDMSVQVFFGDTIRHPATSVAHSDLDTLLAEISEARAAQEERVLNIRPMLLETVMSVIIRNVGPPIDKAKISVSSTSPFTPMTAGILPFSPTQTAYDIDRLPDYRTIGAEIFLSLKIPMPAPATIHNFTVIVEADGYKPKISVARLCFRKVHFPNPPAATA